MNNIHTLTITLVHGSSHRRVIWPKFGGDNSINNLGINYAYRSFNYRHFGNVYESENVCWPSVPVATPAWTNLIGSKLYTIWSDQCIAMRKLHHQCKGRRPTSHIVRKNQPSLRKYDRHYIVVRTCVRLVLLVRDVSNKYSKCRSEAGHRWACSISSWRLAVPWTPIIQ